MIPAGFMVPNDDGTHTRLCNWCATSRTEGDVAGLEIVTDQEAEALELECVGCGAMLGDK